MSEAPIFLETVIYDSVEGVILNVREISYVYGNGNRTVVIMASRDTFTVRDSFESFSKKLKAAISR